MIKKKDLIEVYKAAKFLIITSAPFTSQQEECWPSLKKAVNKIDAKKVKW